MGRSVSPGRRGAMTDVAGAEAWGARVRPVGRLHGRGARAVRTVRAPRCVAVAQGHAARAGVDPLRARRGPGDRPRGARRERCAAVPARERDRSAGERAPVPARQPHLPRARRLRSADAPCARRRRGAARRSRLGAVLGQSGTIAGHRLRGRRARDSQRAPRGAAEPRTRQRPRRPRILRLDPQAPFGYVRDWQPPGLAPLRHLAYAIQWWSFATLALIVWAILSTRRNPAAPTR